jgi:hypothetical protein
MQKALALIVVMLYPVVLWSHPGGIDRHGGHACWRNCSEWELKKGEYHLHDELGNPIRIIKKRPQQHTLHSGNTELQDTGTPDVVPPQAALPAAPHAQTPVVQTTIEAPPATQCISVHHLSLALLLIALLLLLLLIRIRRRNSAR